MRTFKPTYSFIEDGDSIEADNRFQALQKAKEKVHKIFPEEIASKVEIDVELILEHTNLNDIKKL